MMTAKSVPTIGGNSIGDVDFSSRALRGALTALLLAGLLLMGLVSTAEAADSAPPAHTDKVVLEEGQSIASDFPVHQAGPDDTARGEEGASLPAGAWVGLVIAFAIAGLLLVVSMSYVLPGRLKR